MPNAQEEQAPGAGALTQFAPALFVLLWATGFIGAKYGLSDAEPLTFLSYRFALVSVLFALICLIFTPKNPITARGAFHSFIAGAFIHGLYLGGVFVAVSRGLPPAITALVVGLQPLFTAILAAPLLGERITARHWFGLLLGFAGLALVVAPKMTGSAATITPQMLAFACIGLIGVTVGTVYQKYFAANASLRLGGLMQYLGGTTIVAIGATLFESWQITWTPQVIGAMAWLIIVLSLGAISLLMILIQQGAVSKVSTLFYMVPPVTAVMTFVLFGDTLNAVQLTGVVVTALAVWIVLRGPISPT